MDKLTSKLHLNNTENFPEVSNSWELKLGVKHTEQICLSMVKQDPDELVLDGDVISELFSMGSFPRCQ